MKLFHISEAIFGKMGFALTYSMGVKFDRPPMLHIKVPGINLFIYTIGKYYDVDCFSAPQYGLYYADKALVICYGKETKFLHMPWSWEHVRHSILMRDGTWFQEVSYKLGGSDMDKWREQNKHVDENRLSEIYAYEYILNSGKKQNVNAKIGVEEREWRWRWFKWLPFPRMLNRVIDIDFDNEVGERTGSWKGGTVGCSYKLKKNETPLQCLRRMEKERRFR